MKLLRLLTICSFILAVATSAAAQPAMMQGDAQRSRVFATQSADRPSRLLWQVEKLFRIRYSNSFSDRIGSAVLFGELSTGHDFTPPLISGDTIFFATY
ncbi:MAG TPA: hypothetical protein VF353_05425, partial [Candidatus Binatia bacterium]